MELKEVFEPIVNFLRNFQKKQKDISKDKAKERLQLVLMQDRASVSPDFFEMMKKELIEVIKKYIDIDEEALEVQLTRGFENGDDSGPALYANIPIKNIKPVAKKVENKEEKVETAEVVTEQDIKDEMINEVKEKIDELSERAEKETAKVAENVDKVVEETDSTLEEVKNDVEEIKEEVVDTIEEAEEVADAIDNIETEEDVKTANSQISNLKSKLNNVKDGALETFTKVKNGAKEGIQKIKNKASNKNTKKKIND